MGRDAHEVEEGHAGVAEVARLRVPTPRNDGWFMLASVPQGQANEPQGRPSPGPGHAARLLLLRDAPQDDGMRVNAQAKA